MAIRDRLLVHTDDGPCGLEVTRQGGSIEVTGPSKNDPWLRAWINDKSGKQTDETLTVSGEHIIWVARDQAPKVKPKK